MREELSKTTFRLGPKDKKLLEEIRKVHKLPSRSEALRFVLRYWEWQQVKKR